MEMTNYMQIVEGVEIIRGVLGTAPIRAAIANHLKVSQCFCGWLLIPLSSISDVDGILAIAIPAGINPAPHTQSQKLEYSILSKGGM